jgi:hypothetical protein
MAGTEICSARVSASICVGSRPDDLPPACAYEVCGAAIRGSIDPNLLQTPAACAYHRPRTTSRRQSTNPRRAARQRACEPPYVLSEGGNDD